jgi:hypothetical protein
MKLISNSRRKTWAGCRRRFQFRYMDNLEPVVDSPVLTTGRLLHACLQAFYKDKIVLFDSIIRQWLEAYRKAVMGVDAEVLEFEPGDKAEEIGDLVRGLMAGYVARHADDLDKWEVLAVEKEFTVPLRTLCGACKGAGCDKCGGAGQGRTSSSWSYHLILDLLIREEGHVWVVEHKSTTLTNPDEYERDLSLDTQPRGYVYAAAKLCEERGWPKPIGVLYNCLRRKVPSEPKATQCRSCKATGKAKDGSLCVACAGSGVGGLSATMPDSTVQVFLDTLRKYPHLKSADYQEQIAALQMRGDRFYYRFRHFVSDAEILDWQRETYQVCRDIDTTDYYYRNTEGCKAYGRRCPYYRLCIEDNELARRNFKTREESTDRTVE